MKIQAVVCELISHIESVTGKPGKGLAVADRKGHFLLSFEGRAGGEFQRVQIDDRAGEQFYIRLKDGKVDEQTATGYKRGGCNRASLISARCRLVVQSECHSIGDLAWNFRAALTTFKTPQIGLDIFKVAAQMQMVEYDFTSIFYQETTEAERDSGSGWEGSHQLIAIDFKLEYILEACSDPVQIC